MKRIDSFLGILLFLIIGTMAFSMAVNVFCRFCLKFSLSWADELSLSLLVWLTFLGAAVAVREGLHYSFSYFDGCLSGGKLRLFRMLYKVITLIAVTIMLIGSVTVTLGIIEWKMPAMEISRAWVYGASVVGSIIMVLYSVADIVSCYKSK